MMQKPGRCSAAPNNPIELNVLPVDTVADWCGVVESEARSAVQHLSGPLMRATVLPASDGTSIVLTFHHAIVDGLSGTRILHDFMRALAGDRLEVLPPPPLLEEMICECCRLSTNRRRKDDFSRHLEGQPGCTRVPKSSPPMWRLRNGTRKRPAASCASARQMERPRMAQSVLPPLATFQEPRVLDVIRMHCPIDLSRMMRSETTGCARVYRRRYCRDPCREPKVLEGCPLYCR